MAHEGTVFESLNLADLKAHPDRVSPAQRIALVRADQRRAWSSGQKVTVEELLQRYPALAKDAEAAIDLAYSEYILRTESGEKVEPEEYARRFPKQAAAIRRQLALHLALQQMTFAGDSSVSPGDTPAGSPSTTMQTAPRAPETIMAAGDPYQTVATGPPVFASLPPTAPPTMAREVADAFQTLMQAPATRTDELPTPPTDAEGEVSVPGYEIISELGRGGMGVVYKARQRRLDRLVALKMILSGEFASKSDRDRFREEAVKLARVQHPNIVQIYEVSEYEGRPYFAMEYLDGGSLIKEISGQPLTPRIAARLILSLANAVHAAHEKGIVHRDLKPGNILLTAGGLRAASERGASVHLSSTSSADVERGPIAKITDFGLAKGIDGGGESHTLSNAILGTPSYMAPEQAKGKSKSAGPPADIYALGAILYECLTGRPPFLAPNAIDTIYLVVHEEPVKPSAWDPKLPQDIETICLKCLEKLPERRYSSAKALAEDLEAFLDNRPIQARPVGLVERSIKWARRRPAQAALVGTLALAGIVALGVGAWVSEQRRVNLNEQVRLTNEATTAKNTAEKERQRAEENEKAAKEEEQKARQAAEAESIAKKEQERLKIEALKSFENEKKAKEKAVEEEQRAKQAELAAKTAQAETEKMFGYAREAVNSYFTSVSQETLLDEPGMEALRKTLLEQASKFYEKFAEERKNDPSVRAELAAAWGRLGKIRAAIDRKSEGIALYQQALGLYKQLEAERPQNAEIAAALAEAYFELGVLFRDTKQEAAAIEAGKDAVDRWDALACKPPDNEEYKAELARSLNGLGGTYADFKRYDLARGPLDRALGIRKQLVDVHPDSEPLLRDLAVTYDNIATVAKSRGEFQAAEQAHKDALAIGELLVKKNSDRTLYRNDLARYFLNLGNLYAENGDVKLAADSYAQAADLWSELSRSHPRVKQFRYAAVKANRLLAEGQYRLALNKELQSREADADAAIKRSREQLQALLQDEPENSDYQTESASIELVNANQHFDRRKYAEAAAGYRNGVELLEKIRQKVDDLQHKRLLASALVSWAVCLQRIDQPASGRAERLSQAVGLLQRSSALWKQLVAGDPQNVRYRRNCLECLVELARLDLDLDDAKGALAATDDGLPIGESLRGDAKPGSREKLALQRLFWRRAQALTALERYDDALAAWDETLKLEDNPSKSIFSIYRLATVARSPQYAEAVAQAAKIRQQFPRSGYVLYELARVHALAARAVGGNSTDNSSAGGKYAADAVQILEQSRKLAAVDDPQVRTNLATDRDWAGLATSKDWDSLRQRDDFKKLLNEIKNGRSS
jgi:serine/threonine protein kinase